MDLNEMYSQVSTSVDAEDKLPISGYGDFIARLQNRSAIQQRFVALRKEVDDLGKKIEQLPKLPDLELVHWARSVLRFSNLRFLVIDTTGREKDSDIIRILLTNGSGQSVLDTFVRPTRQASMANTRYTGISVEQIQRAPVLSDAWEEVVNALSGNYILSYNLNFVQSRLDDNAAVFSLEPPPFLGVCLMETAKSYFGGSSYMSLPDVCNRIGQPLASQSAVHRARGQLALLRAMGEGLATIGH